MHVGARVRVSDVCMCKDWTRATLTLGDSCCALTSAACAVCTNGSWSWRRVPRIEHTAAAPRHHGSRLHHLSSTTGQQRVWHLEDTVRARPRRARALTSWWGVSPRGPRRRSAGMWPKPAVTRPRGAPHPHLLQGLLRARLPMTLRGSLLGLVPSLEPF